MIINILLIGDIVGYSGRNALSNKLPQIQKEHDIVTTIANIDNAAHGFGFNKKTIYEMQELGVTVMTTGNHGFDQTKDCYEVFENNHHVLRPANYPRTTVGSGVIITTIHYQGQQYKMAVIHLAGQIYFPVHVNDPFECVDDILLSCSLKKNVDIIIVDFHAEATSEKQTMGHYLDGRVSAVLGTHTHVPSRDYRILPNGTAYQTDVGMCGDYNSVIGMQKETAINRMVTKINAGKRFTPAEGPGTVCATMVSVNTDTGLATNIQHIMI